MAHDCHTMKWILKLIYFRSRLQPATPPANPAIWPDPLMGVRWLWWPPPSNHNRHRHKRHQLRLRLLSTAPPCRIVAVTVETTPLPTSSMTTKTTTVAGMVHNATFVLCLIICHWPHGSDTKKTEDMARSTNFGEPGDIGFNIPFDMFILACVFPFSWKIFRKEWIDLNAIPEYNQSLQQRDWGSFI